jgi:hypothetical protein
MTRTLSVALAVLAVAPVLAIEQSTDEQARERFADGVAARTDVVAARSHFAAAAGLFDKAWQDGDRDAPTALGRTRAHYLAGDLPGAILAVHDGLSVNPWNSDLQRDLELCRSAVAYPTTEKPEERIRPAPPAALRNRVSPGDLLFSSAGFALILAAGLAARLTARPAWSVPAVVAGFVGLLCVGAVTWLSDREERRDQLFPVAVVSANRVTLRTGNAADYPPRIESSLPRGAEVRVVGRRGGWLHVRLAGGAVGWLPGSAVVGVEDASAIRR